MSHDEKGRNQAEDVKSKMLRMVFVCEERNEDVETQLSAVANAIFSELVAENLLSFLKQSEVNMYKNYCKLLIIYML